jgi:uncharacterized OsmC-like protein
VIKAIRVAYTLVLKDPDKEEEAWRAHSVHPPKCPVYKTLEGCIEMTTTMEIVSS